MHYDPRHSLHLRNWAPITGKKRPRMENFQLGKYRDDLPVASRDAKIRFRGFRWVPPGLKGRSRQQKVSIPEPQGSERCASVWLPGRGQATVQDSHGSQEGVLLDAYRCHRANPTVAKNAESRALQWRVDKHEHPTDLWVLEPTVALIERQNGRIQIQRTRRNLKLF